LQKRKNRVSEEELKKCAMATKNFSGSEIEVIINEAASKAI